VRLLLDTHVFLWWNGNAEAIRLPLQIAIAEPDNEIYVSAATVWEISLKRAGGKLRFDSRIVDAIGDHGFQLLPITGEHAEHAGGLPRHLGDPFDRMLVAQAMLERMVLGTQDPKMTAYGVASLGLSSEP
jgi:PIN domain nuclease of toxin-antitoxin system